jgi:hypothetical protein
MDPMQFLTTRNALKRRVMWSVAREAQRIREIEHRNLAVFIQEGIGKLLGAK